MRTEPNRRTGNVIGSPIDVIGWDAAVERVMRWARARESRYVCICNAHSVVTAAQEPDFRRVIEAADMATPDGAPVAWMLRRVGHAGQARINGPDLMLRLCEAAARDGTGIYLFGSTPDTLDALESRLMRQWPALHIAGRESPAFRAPTAEEDAAQVTAINDSRAGIVFVSLGCPKQERWMAAHRGRVGAVAIGVGAAFDFHAGTVTRAPEWMRRNGLEWLHRLLSEPGRLWKRYLVTNTAFIIGATRQLLSRNS